MHLRIDPTRLTTPHEAAGDGNYDAVIVGSGVSGAMIAEQLCKEGKRVLMLEAGPITSKSLRGYNDYVTNYFVSPGKDSQAPFPENPNAPMPRTPLLRKLQPGQVDSNTYMVQTGPYVTDTVYSRTLGGTTMHWQAKTPRMVPEDFKTRTLYDQGLDWPISYDDLEPDYQRAEREMGVSGDVTALRYPGGSPYPKDYVYPMKGMPPSYLDQMVNDGIEGTSVELDGQTIPLQVRPFPQARNGIPNEAYDGGKGYTPIGAVNTHQVDFGERCQGNTNCVPICPVQAKYWSGKTLAKVLRMNDEPDKGEIKILPQAVASKVEINPENGHVAGIQVKVYKNPDSPEHETITVRGKIYVITTAAIETARLLLASGLPSTSGLVGRNYIDHAYLFSWGLTPKICGAYRGTDCISGILDLRNGPFRKHQAAFSVDINNNGWSVATSSPYTDVTALVDDGNLFGSQLRRGLVDRVSRQLLFAFMIDVPANESNRVTVDPQYTDALGNMRPNLSFTTPEYSMRGAAYARQFAKTVFSRMGVIDYTQYSPSNFGYVVYEGEGYEIHGGCHLGGTHIMGTNKNNSVVDANQRSWDHANLYLAGGGSMPSIGTANITLTIAALCYRSTRAMLKQLS
ncbi:MAG: GMC family oxidoreductase [Nitrospirae bacterium]|nr:GMC family oxidoreductase [Magnetococcales bacterium]HAT50897.1 GMC family oxidoreductase [Alphaproteobacteria bacterium]